MKCDAVSSRRPCWSRDIRRRRLPGFEGVSVQCEPCVAKTGKQNLSENRKCDTGLCATLLDPVDDPVDSVDDPVAVDF